MTGPPSPFHADDPSPPAPSVPTTVVVRPQIKENKWGLFVALAVAAVVFYLLRYLMLPFAGAAAIAFVTTPLVNKLAKKIGGRRRIAALVVFAGILLLTLGIGWWIKAVLVPQGLEMARDLPGLVQQMVTRLIDGHKVNVLGHTYDNASAVAAINEATSKWTSGSLVDLAAYAAAGAMGIFLAYVLLFYFLVSGPRIVAGMVWLLPPRHRHRAWTIADRIRPMLFHYFFGLIVIVVYTTVVAWIGTLFIIHAPHAAVIAVTVGVLELLPVVGPIMSGIVLAATAFERSQHMDLAIGFLAFAVVLRLSIDQVVGPLVLGRAVTLHPVVIIFAFLAGGILFGAIGVLLAIPAAATVKILLESAYGDAGTHQHPPRRSASA